MYSIKCDCDVLLAWDGGKYTFTLPCRRTIGYHVHRNLLTIAHNGVLVSTEKRVRTVILLITLEFLIISVSPSTNPSTALKKSLDTIITSLPIHSQSKQHSLSQPHDDDPSSSSRCQPCNDERRSSCRYGGTS